MEPRAPFFLHDIVKLERSIPVNIRDERQVCAETVGEVELLVWDEVAGLPVT
jgi:hypothetical protein